jgi:MoCo/4Fe-4S cofactor protein with predicted Tat translocation signal
MEGREPAGFEAGSFVPLDTVGGVTPRLDLAAVRARLAATRGRQYWRSLEELADAPEFRQLVEREFPLHAPRDMAPLSRREFMRVMGASLALAGAAGCSYQPPEKIVPYVNQPEQLVPGKPLFYATAYQREGYALGVLGESHMGRPTKIEGNPDHPASLGSTDIFAQASLLTLYDPDRSQAVRHEGDFTTWEAFLTAIGGRLQSITPRRGAGLRILTGTITSPTLASQLRKVFKLYPEAKVHVYDPAGRDSARDGARLAFHGDAHAVYDFGRANVILALDSDFLVDEPGSVRYARGFIDGRRVRQGRTKMNRLYVVESTTTLTGANADHRLPLRPSAMKDLAWAVASLVGADGGGSTHLVHDPPSGVSKEWVQAVAEDLEANRGACLVIAGRGQPPVVHALAHAMNLALGNAGKTVTFTEPVEAQFGDRQGSLPDLVADMRAGRVETLLILGSNPVYDAPADLNFTAAFQRVPLRVHLGIYDDETAALCQWHLPQSHYLEAWSDARAFDGTASIVQPLIVPLYTTRSIHEFVAILVGESSRAGYDIVREYWQRRAPKGGFDQLWHQALVTGVIPGTQAPQRQVTVETVDWRGLWPALVSGRAGPAQAGAGPAQAGKPAPPGLEIVFRPDPSIADGEFSNNGWLQELPKPFTSLTWDNAALVSLKTAEDYHLANGDMVELTQGGRRLRTPVWIAPAHPDDCVTLSLGYGRTRAGKLGTGAGFDTYSIRTSGAPWFATGAEMRKTGGGYKLAQAQRHFSQEGRHLARGGPIQEFDRDPKDPAFMRAEGEAAGSSLPSLYPQEWPSDAKGPAQRGEGPQSVGRYPDPGYNDGPIPAWGMVIDLNACIGCNACTIACQAENNIPTVGKDQVVMHRQMHWIRVDNYFTGDDQQHPQTMFQPVPCMHCEKAPCEPVCPVEATSHSAEGINEQTYNRCIGTRYCQNNCPYKVRRFNYLQYSQQQTPTIELMANPDVTVRSRGVMEKCTYCIQRINEARIQAEKEDRRIRDGDVLPACAQACPTQAIVFGDINDRKSNDGRGSRVRQLKLEPLNYDLLAELNTRPRTSYLARLRNPNPRLARLGSSPGQRERE